MELSGEYLIPAPKQAVWDALNDPDVLKHSAAQLRQAVLIADQLLGELDPGFLPSHEVGALQQAGQAAHHVNRVEEGPAAQGQRRAGPAGAGAATAALLSGCADFSNFAVSLPLKVDRNQQIPGSQRPWACRQIQHVVVV